MGARSCSATSKFFWEATCGEHVAGGCLSIRERVDAGKVVSCMSSSTVIGLASMDFGTSPDGLRGSNLSMWDSRVLRSYRNFLRVGYPSHHGHQRAYVTETGLLHRGAESFSSASAWRSGIKVQLSRNLGIGANRVRFGERLGEWRVRAKEEATQQDGYWEGDDREERGTDIEDMMELVGEAENFRSAEMARGAPVELTPEEIEKQRAEKLRQELARQAKAQAEQRKQAEIMFGMGQRAYGRGVYDKSVELLEAALTNVPGSSKLGGEIQIWLAMAYEAVSRHGDCIALYKRIEATHPNKQIRRQAADLRYILEAPKLKISKEEMVSIPIIERDYDRGSKSWSQKIRDSKRKPMAKSQSRDYLEDWLIWDPPRWERNPYFWVALTIWLTLVGVSLMFQD